MLLYNVHKESYMVFLLYSHCFERFPILIIANINEEELTGILVGSWQEIDGPFEMSVDCAVLM